MVGVAEVLEFSDTGVVTLLKEEETLSELEGVSDTKKVELVDDSCPEDFAKFDESSDFVTTTEVDVDPTDEDE